MTSHRSSRGLKIGGGMTLTLTKTMESEVMAMSSLAASRADVAGGAGSGSKPAHA